jgi:D-threonate/D-erythronate kinase
VLILADDATGALEMGALLAPCTVSLGVAAEQGVIDTESRHLPPEHAAARVRSVLTDVPPRFKKIDSTLRGPIRAELEAIADAYPRHALIVCPAYPQFGRTVLNGILLVDGIPVAESAFARDPRLPVIDSRVPWPRVYDAETDAELAQVAALCGPDCIGVGSGGLARYLFGSPVRAQVPAAGKWLVVCGSMHRVSLRQAEVASHHGIAVVSGIDAAREAVAQAADGLIIFGGETTYATLRAMGLTAVTTVGEILPGVPLSMAGNLPVITKAGGFGSDDLVPAILQTA